MQAYRTEVNYRRAARLTAAELRAAARAAIHRTLFGRGE